MEKKKKKTVCTLQLQYFHSQRYRYCSFVISRLMRTQVPTRHSYCVDLHPHSQTINRTLLKEGILLYTTYINFSEHRSTVMNDLGGIKLGAAPSSDITVS